MEMKFREAGHFCQLLEFDRAIQVSAKEVDHSIDSSGVFAVGLGFSASHGCLVKVGIQTKGAIVCDSETRKVSREAAKGAKDGHRIFGHEEPQDDTKRSGDCCSNPRSVPSGLYRVMSCLFVAKKSGIRWFGPRRTVLRGLGCRLGVAVGSIGAPL